VPSERMERRLSAILAADVAGYSRLMGLDEEGTLAQLKAIRRALVDPKIAEHRGRLVKTTGDGMLVEFVSVVDAVRCAVKIQRAMIERNADVENDNRIEFRIGVHQGDIIADDDDIHGDGVNVAARLEELSEPGAICISGRVHEDVHGKLEIRAFDAGEQQLKNIARPVRIYHILLDANDTEGAASPAALGLPDKPSIAVLPFQNMSSDAEQEYFADGMVEDIITALSRMRWLFVIARNSSFIYKGRSIDIRQVGRDLGVRYVLEGSVRKSGTRVRITGQLIDASSGAHLWVDRFDGDVGDIFELQDRITASVVSAIAPKLEQAEIERAKRKPTGNLSAYDYYLRGLANFYQGTRKAIDEAIRLFSEVIALDPEFSSAYGMAAWCYIMRNNNGWMIDTSQEIGKMRWLAREAARWGKDDPLALCAGGIVLVQVVGDLSAGMDLIDRALVLDPNLAAAWHVSGWGRIHGGDPETAIEHLTRAIRLSPLDPLLYGMQNGVAAAHFLAGRYDEAASWARKALREQPNYLPAMRFAAASLALAGRLDEAQVAIARMCGIDPALRVSGLKGLVPFRRPADIARYADGLRKAGLQE